ncbi:MAG: NAD-dependent epimerase/dehydratase family protein [Cyclobacteriaceae bacterium]|nr:NAD-dependent epimerase/dehydratase family protein [Cyclobacteriaceae bacterium]
MIVVTGSNGLIGSAIAQRLLSEGFSLSGLKRDSSDMHLLTGQCVQQIQWKTGDILDIGSLNECFKNASVVIHAAAKVSFNSNKKRELFQVNVEGTKNVVNACLANGVNKLIHISSVAALGQQKGITLIDETSKWEESPLNSSYAKSKYLAELEVYRGMEEGLPASIVNPSLVLGRGNWEKSSSKLFQYVWKENKFYSSGQCNYVDIRDVVEIVFKLLNGNFLPHRFIASGGVITYKDIFEKIAFRLKKKAPSIKVSPFLVNTIARLEEMKGWLLNTNPLVTRESVKSASEKFTFSNQKSIYDLGMKYHPLDQTIDYCCEYYLRSYSTNK